MFETEILSRQQTTVPVEILAKFIFDESNEIIGIQGTTRDIRNRKETEAAKKDLEQQLIKAQKFEALGTLAGGIAHDFNNILSAVIGFSELALEDSVEGTNFHSNIQQIQIVGNRARELVLQILAFARQTEAEVRPVRVDRIAKEALKLINTSLPRIIRIEANIYSETRVLADPVQIHQVLMNLCTNAAHAMREKGSILGVDIKRSRLQKPII